MSSDEHVIEISRPNGPPLAFEIKNGCISIKQLQKFFPNITGLMYEKDDKKFCITNDENEDVIYIKAGVHSYEVYQVTESTTAVDSWSKKKNAEYQSLLDDITNLGGYDMKMELQKKSTKIGSKTNDSRNERVIYIAWRHRQKSTEAYKPLSYGNWKQMKLFKNMTYSVENIKDVAIPIFNIDNITNGYFTNSSIEIGNRHNIVITQFINDQGEQGLWAVEDLFLDDAKRFKVTILTTYSTLVTPSAASTSETSLNESNARSSSSKINLKSDNTLNNSMHKSKRNYKDVVPYQVAYENKRKNEVPVAVGIRMQNSTQFQNKGNFVENDGRPQSKKAKLGHFKIPSRPIKSSISAVQENNQLIYNLDKLNLNCIDQYKSNLVSFVPFTDLMFVDVVLGKGTFGIVRKAYWNGTAVAIKCFNTFKSRSKAIFREITLLRELSHENFVSIMGVSMSTSMFYIILEFVDGKNLKQILFHKDVKDNYNLTPTERDDMGFQLTKAIHFLHNHPSKLLHRDIKPANILYSKTRKILKVCDMGISTSMNFSPLLASNDSIRQAHGTSYYMAPEVYSLTSKPTVYSDVWSLACVLIQLYSESDLWVIEEKGSNAMELVFLNESVPVIGTAAKTPTFLREILKKCFIYHKFDSRPSAQNIFHLYEKQQDNCQTHLENADSSSEKTKPFEC